MSDEDTLLTAEDVAMKGQSEVMALRKQEFDDNNDRPTHEAEPVLLTIDVDTALLRRIEEAASASNLSVEEYLGQILDQFVPKEVETTQ